MNAMKLTGLVLVLCLLATGASAQQPVKIQGIWQLVSQKMDGTTSPPTTMLKTITKGRWSWIVGDKEKMMAHLAKKTKDDTLAAFANDIGAGFGSYTLVGDVYTEKIEFMSFLPFIGRSFPFKVKIQGGHLFQSGKLPITDADGKTRDVLLEEEYKRLE
jgi:hypothetical protein